MSSGHDAERLVLAAGVRAYRDEVDRLQSRLDEVTGWLSVIRGPNAKKGLPKPSHGREGPYPGVPKPEHADPDNVAHYRWALMMHSFMYRTGTSSSEVADEAGLDRKTVRLVLTGEQWGMAETRLAMTWAVWCRALPGLGVGSLLTAIAQDGLWLPLGVTDPVWHLHEGRVRWRRCCSAGPERILFSTSEGRVLRTLPNGLLVVAPS